MNSVMSTAEPRVSAVGNRSQETLQRKRSEEDTKCEDQQQQQQHNQKSKTNQQNQKNTTTNDKGVEKWGFE